MKPSERRRFEKMTGRELAAEAAKPRPPLSAAEKKKGEALRLAADIEEFRRSSKGWSKADLARVWLVAHLLRLWADQNFHGSGVARAVILEQARNVAGNMSWLRRVTGLGRSRSEWMLFVTRIAWIDRKELWADDA